MPDIVERTKRPVTVRTLEWTGLNIPEMRAFCGGDFRVIYQPDSDAPAYAEVYDKLHGSWITVYPGNHVVQGVRNEFYPIDEGVLAETYEPPAPDADERLRRSEEDGAITRLLDAENGRPE